MCVYDKIHEKEPEVHMRRSFRDRSHVTLPEDKEI